MRILYCNKYNYAFSGTEVYLFEAMELMRSKGHEVALFSMADSRGEAHSVRSPFHAAHRFQEAERMASQGAAGGARDLFTRGTAADSGDDRRIPPGRSPRAEHLSPSVAIDFMGVEGAGGSGRLSLERFQSAMSELQPGLARRSLRGLQGRRVLARTEGEVLSGMGGADDAGGRGLSSTSGWARTGNAWIAFWRRASSYATSLSNMAGILPSSRFCPHFQRVKPVVERMPRGTLRCFTSAGCRRKKA